MTLLHPDARLIDAASGAVTGGTDLAERVAAAAEAYQRRATGVVFARIPLDVAAVIRYLGAWTASRPVALLDPAMPGAALNGLINRYQPAMVTGVGEGVGDGAAPGGYRRLDDPPLGAVWERLAPVDVIPHPDLGILLTTSGSTGNPKLVRLSRDAILANAASIVEALGIDAGEVAPTTLPLHYSYGMSVLHSHLSVGAAVLVEAGGLMHRPFWTAVTEHGATSLAAVPYQYEMLRRLRFDPAGYPRLRTLTQAGGRLRAELLSDFDGRMVASGGRMFVMYGQTEAGPRITTLPAGRLGEKPGSAGPAIPGGRLSIRLDDGAETTAPGVVGEVLYRGRNVMMGYADTAADLARGDELGGLLATGDLGHLDEDGYLFLSGRSKRIGKVFGLRINLDDIEEMLRGRGAVAAVNGDDRLVVFVEGAPEPVCADVAGELADRLKVHRTGLDVRAIEALPLLGNGKVDYRALESLA